MDQEKREYYKHMLDINRGYLLVRNGHLTAVLTYFIGDDDNKYLIFKKQWTVVDDDENGTTLYIDQLLTNEPTHKFIHKEFTRILRTIKKSFPKLERAKWLRANALLRKKGVKNAGNKIIIHSKDIK